MLNKNTTFETELIVDKVIFSTWIYLLLIGIVIGLASLLIPIQEIKIVGLLLSVFFLLFGILYTRRKTKIRVSDDELIIENYFLGKKSSKKYSLSKIENLRYNRQVKSSYSTSSTEIEIIGVDVTPESSKKHYFHNEIISFDYEKKKVEIGKWKKYFGGHNINNLLKQKISLLEKSSIPPKETKREYKK